MNQALESEAYITCWHATLRAVTTIKTIAAVIAYIMLMHWFRHSHGFFFELAHSCPPSLETFYVWFNTHFYKMQSSAKSFK